MKKILAMTLATLVALLPVTVFASTSDTTQVSAVIGNRPPVVYNVQSISAKDPTESSSTTIAFNTSVDDPEGYGSISKVNATFSKGGETARTTSTCTPSDIINDTARKFSCTINMQFYDGSGSWAVNVSAFNNGALWGFNDSTSFTYNTLTAWTMATHSMSFGTIYLGQTGAGATDDPIVMTNTGNADLSGLIKVKALDLKGVTNTSQYLPAGDFSGNIADSAGGDAMINNTAKLLTGTSLAKGVSSTESLYFYIESVPTSDLSYQTYNTAGLGQWTITTD
jgi:hypothetical protein